MTKRILTFLLPLFLCAQPVFAASPFKFCIDALKRGRNFLIDQINGNPNSDAEAIAPRSQVNNDSLKSAEVTSSVDPLTRTTRELGFEYNPNVTIDMQKALEIFVRDASLYDLGAGLGGFNGLTGEPRNPRAGDSIFYNNQLTPDQKRAEFLNRYLIQLNGSNTEVLQNIRNVNKLEEKYGFYALWVDLYQIAYTMPGANRDAVQHYHSFDGLIYRLNPDGSLLVAGNNYFAGTNLDEMNSSILKLISKANGGKAVLVSNLQIIQGQRGSDIGSSSTRASFFAEVRPYVAGETVPDGAVMIENLNVLPELQGKILVPPFEVQRDIFGLSRANATEWVLRFQTAYDFRIRVSKPTTINYVDLEAVIDAAAIDSGIDPDVVNHRSKLNEGSDIVIKLPAEIVKRAGMRFEENLIYRLNELKLGAEHARRSQRSPWKFDVTPEEANAAESSGFDNRDAAVVAIGFDTAKTGSTSSGGELWKATYPILHFNNQRSVSISVDDRIYGSYGLNVTDIKGFAQARSNPMTPVKLSTGAYIVLNKMNRAPFWSGYIENYMVFSTLERAKYFIDTHRFVLVKR